VYRAGSEHPAAPGVRPDLDAWINGSLYLELHGREDGRTRSTNRVALANWVMSHLPIALAITAADAGMVSLIGHAMTPTRRRARAGCDRRRGCWHCCSWRSSP
jgi:hypothetical protein